MTWTLVAQIAVLTVIVCVAAFVVGGIFYAAKNGRRER